MIRNDFRMIQDEEKHNAGGAISESVLVGP